MSRKKKDEEAGSSKPFFARYLEGQDTEASSAKVGGNRSLSYKKASATPVTMKAPSDNDELLYCPYYPTEAAVPEKYRGPKLVTLKYPSDNDEWVFNAEYISKAAVPKAAATLKEGTVKLKKRSTSLKKK
jgi:Serine endopeptidase inhibitors